MNSNEKDYMEIDLLRLAEALWRRAWAIILATVLGALIAFSYVTLLVTPLYRANALFYVSNRSISIAGSSLSISSGEIYAAKSLVDTYTVILKTRMTLEAVIKEADLPYSYNTLYNMVQTSSVNDTEIFQVSVTSPNREETTLIANTIAEVLPEKIANIVDGSSVKVVDYAVVPSSKISPNVTKYTMMGAVMGFVIACGIIVVLQLLDNVIHDEEYLYQTYNIPVLAAIPDLEETTSGGYYGKSKSGGKS